MSPKQSKQVTAKVLDRVYVHIASCISGSSTVADAGSIWPRGPGEDGTGHSNSMHVMQLPESNSDIKQKIYVSVKCQKTFERYYFWRKLENITAVYLVG